MIARAFDDRERLRARQYGHAFARELKSSDSVGECSHRLDAQIHPWRPALRHGIGDLMANRERRNHEDLFSEQMLAADFCQTGDQM